MKQLFLLLLIFPIYYLSFSQIISSNKSGTIDVGVIQITEPADTINIGQHTVKVYIKNFGTDSITSIPIEYSMNGMNIVQEIWTGTISLLPGDSMLYTFTTPFMTPIGQFMFCAKTFLQNDVDTTNNMVCKTVFGSMPVIIYDLGVSAIVKPDSNKQVGTSGIVKIIVKNFGNTIHSSSLYNYKIGNNPPVTEYVFIPPDIYPGDSIEYIFTTPFQWPLGNAQLCAWVSVDSWYNNDTSCLQITGTPPNIDVGISEIEQPTDTIKANTNIDVKAWIKNFGLDSINTVPIQYSINGVLIAQEIWNDSTTALAQDDSVIYTFSTTFNSTPKNISLCVKTMLPTDTFNINDYLCDNSIIVVIDDINENKIRNFSFSQNHPNPTSGITTIQYYVPRAGKLQFELYDILGNKIMHLIKSVTAGESQLSIDISKYKSGMYFYSLEFEKTKYIKKMIVR